MSNEDLLAKLFEQLLDANDAKTEKEADGSSEKAGSSRMTFSAALILKR